MEHVIIVGAGPYGLSVAAHLEDAGVPYRIFGQPLVTWREHMPKGMLLKSEGYASSLSAPGNGVGTLEEYCRSQRLPYRHLDSPVSLKIFTDYAMAFQQRFVPKLEKADVISIQRAERGFSVDLENGGHVPARHLIMATGISWFNDVPRIFGQLPETLVSHTYSHHTVDQFAGKQVVVIGAGASAADIAIQLADSGAAVQILARNSQIRFQRPPPPGGRTVFQKIKHPQSVIGPGWRSKLYTTAPLSFHKLPASLREGIVRTHLGPAPGWFVRERIEGRIPIMPGVEVESATVQNDRVALKILKDDGTHCNIVGDHVVVATGYTVDLRRIPILSHELRGHIAHYRHSPLLSNNFESSISGLYFVGPAAAHAFGPLMRFMVGAEWVAPRLTRHLRQKVQHG